MVSGSKFVKLKISKNKHSDSFSVECPAFQCVQFYKTLLPPVWHIHFHHDTEWGDEWGNGHLRLDGDVYTEQDIKQIVQDAWEHYVMTTCFEKEE